MSGSASATELLLALVRTPSPSGQESAAASMLEAWARHQGLAVERDDAAVRIEVRGRGEGPALLLASHLDTVPPGEGWSVDPYGGEVRDGRVVARGACDAKGSVAAMAAAAATVAAAGGPARGRLILLATFSEETRDTTMPEALRRLPVAPDAAVVGEPTDLEPCVAQRGQLLLRLVRTGDQVHAGWAAGRHPAPANAIRLAAADILALESLRFPRVHPLLGEVMVTPTMMQAGIARNVTPPRCEAVLDVRTTPAYTHEEVAAAVRACVGGVVEVMSERLVPAETPADSRLLRAVLDVAPEAVPFASPTCSDWVFLRHLDAVKLGPGESRVSHTADEWVALADVEAAARLYAAVAREYLS
ncbi:MAG: M20/M25/M40 family metallo-hydrolase [Acidobacteriota bacterium]